MPTLADLIEELHGTIPDEAWDDVSYRMWLREMYRAMDFLMKSGAWAAANAYLLTLQMEKGDTKRAVAALRFLSDAPRDKLVEWEPLLWRVGIALDAAGLDRARILRGL